MQLSMLSALAAVVGAAAAVWASDVSLVQTVTIE
jgi:hypothetical protein